MKEYSITKPEDERVADFIGLSNHKLRQLREKDGGDMAPYFIGEGITVINRALAVGHKLLTLIVSEILMNRRLQLFRKDATSSAVHQVFWRQ